MAQLPCCMYFGSLTFNTQTQAFAATFLAIMVCLIASMVLIRYMRKLIPANVPPPGAH